MRENLLSSLLSSYSVEVRRTPFLSRHVREGTLFRGHQAYVNSIFLVVIWGLNGTCAAGTSLLNINGDSYWLATREDAVQGPWLTSRTSWLAVLYRAYEDLAHAQDCLRQPRQQSREHANIMLRPASGFETRLEVRCGTFVSAREDSLFDTV